MARNCAVLAVDMGYCDNLIARYNLPLHFAIPLTGIFTVCPDKFLHGKMLVGVVPIYPSVRVKKYLDGVGVLS